MVGIRDLFSEKLHHKFNIAENVLGVRSVEQLPIGNPGGLDIVGRQGPPLPHSRLNFLRNPHMVENVHTLSVDVHREIEDR